MAFASKIIHFSTALYAVLNARRKNVRVSWTERPLRATSPSPRASLLFSILTKERLPTRRDIQGPMLPSTPGFIGIGNLATRHISQAKEQQIRRYGHRPGW